MATDLTHYRVYLAHGTDVTGRMIVTTPSHEEARRVWADLMWRYPNADVWYIMPSRERVKLS